MSLRYPEIFVISRNKEAYVADVMKFPNGVLFWDLIFVRPLRDWEVEPFYNFMDIIYEISSRGVRDNKICWKPAMGSGFTLSSYY